MALAAFPHRGQAFADEVHRAKVVDLELPLLVVYGHIFDGGAIGDACIVDQDVDWTNFRFDVLYEFRGHFIVADIQRVEVNPRAFGNRLGFQFVQ